MRQSFRHSDRRCLFRSTAFSACLSAIVEHRCWAVVPQRTPPQPITVDEDYAAQNLSIIDPLTPLPFQNMGLTTGQLLIRQSE